MTLSMLMSSLLAGWLVNLCADTLPTHRTLQETWAWPFRSLTHPLFRRTRSTIDAAQVALLRPWRTRIVWGLALLLGWLAVNRVHAPLASLVLASQAWFFLAVAVIDLEHRLVLNRMLAVALPIFLLVNWLNHGPPLSAALLGAAAGFGFFLVLALAWPGGMGMGDVKLAGVIGLVLGLGDLWTALFVAILAGGLAGLVVLIRSRRRGQTFAYAPYLVLGVWLVLYFGAHLGPN
ncbi:MAG: A24 family peptidase [Chloroflexi bacterium]|nr:A24 family peptidase [Chloroflexota bacterium]